MRRFVPLVLAALTACTPAEIREWKREFFHGDRAAAIAHVQERPIRCQTRCLRIVRQEAPRVRRLGWGSCRRWFDTALRAGWRTSDWNTMNWVMARESGCDPAAYNPSGASGLMQVMAGWADDCGGAPADLFDPLFNLRCARFVYRAQGWSAWSVW